MKFFLLLALSLGLLSCKGKSSETTNAAAVDLLPSVVDLVAKASPAGLKTQSFDQSYDAVGTMATTSEAAEALKDFFSDNVMSISGITGKGLIKTYLADLDKRIAEIETGTQAPACYTGTTISVTFDSGLTNQSLTLKLSCARKFGGSGDQSGAGSGLAFGQDSTHYYMYLLLIQQNGTDKFGYVAKINKTTEEVDLMFLERTPSSSRTKVFRLRTNPASSKYELNIASTGDSPGPTQSGTAHVLSPGSRLVTSSTEIRVEGTVGAGTTSAGAASPTAYAFDATECFSATNLSTTPATCSSSAPSFSTDMALFTGANVNAVATNVSSALQTITALVTAGVSEM